MLRRLFNEPKRVDSGLIEAVNQAVQSFIEHVEKGTERSEKRYRLSYWAKGFIDSINELEQSVYCAGKFSEWIRKDTEEEMDQEELEHYHLYLYFYKNAFIRLFSNLDKLGHFLNELLDLKTEKMKEKFSYYTVLRQMYFKEVHTDLQQELYALKIKHKEAMNRLRKKRNLEIHFMNVEFLDDLHHISKQSDTAQNEIESPSQNLHDLREGFEMVLKSIGIVFLFAKRMIKST